MNSTRLFRLWNEQIATSVATFVTLSHRLPLIASESVTPTKAGQSEMQTMVTEKILAVHQGIFDASMAAMKASMSAVTQGITPYGAMKASERIVDAAMRPAGRRVRANAKRLSSKS